MAVTNPDLYSRQLGSDAHVYWQSLKLGSNVHVYWRILAVTNPDLYKYRSLLDSVGDFIKELDEKHGADGWHVVCACARARACACVHVCCACVHVCFCVLCVRACVFSVCHSCIHA